MINDLDNLIKDKDPTETYLINGDSYTVLIKPVNEYVEESTVNVNFSECEKKLKSLYPTKEFRIVQVNMANKNEHCLIDQVEYKIYDELGEIINLSVCSDVSIKIEYEIKDTSLLNLEQISNFKDKGIDVFNLKNDFFNDICYPYSDDESNSDMVLSDRVADIYQNYSICGEGCEYESFNMDRMSANCNCQVKQEVSTEKEKGNFQSYIASAFLDSNFGVIKCYNLVFSLKGKLNNIGFFIFSFFIIFHFPIYIFYFVKGTTPISKYINKEMESKGYSTKEEKPIEIRETSKEGLTEENKIKKVVKSRFRKKQSNPPKNNNKKRIQTDFSPKEYIFTKTKNYTFKLYDEENNDNSNNNNSKLYKTKNQTTKSIVHIKLNLNDKKNLKNDEDSKIIKRIIIDKSSFDTRIEKEKVKNNIFSPNINFSGRSINKKLNDYNLLETLKSEGGDSKSSRINSGRKIKKGLLKKNYSIISKLDSKDFLDLNDYIYKKNVETEFKPKIKSKSKFATSTTKGDDKSINVIQNKDKNINNNEFHLILIDANNSENHSPLKSNYILNNYDYKEAINYDKRSFFRIFFIYLISKDKILNIIFFNPPLELKPLRIIVLLFNFACDFALNALFYLSDNISDKYHYSGKSLLLFTLINNLTISLASTIVTLILLHFFESLTHSTSKIEVLFREQEILLKADKKYKVDENCKKYISQSINKVLKCLKIKIIFFLVFEPLLIIFFYYYVTSFCQVYQSTQISWLLDCLSSYAISILIELLISFISTVFYMIAIKYKCKILYKVTIFVYSFG